MIHESGSNVGVKHKYLCRTKNSTTDKLRKNELTGIRKKSLPQKKTVTACSRYRGSICSNDVGIAPSTFTSSYSDETKTRLEPRNNNLCINNSVSKSGGASAIARSTKSEQQNDTILQDSKCTSNNKILAKNYILNNILSVSKNAKRTESVKKTLSATNDTKRVSENTLKEASNLKPNKDNKPEVINDIKPDCEDEETEKTKQLILELKRLLSTKDINIKKLESKIKQIACNTLDTEDVTYNSNKNVLVFFSTTRKLIEELITNALSEHREPPNVMSPAVQKNLPKKEIVFKNDEDLSYYEQYLKELINTFIQDYGTDGACHLSELKHCKQNVETNLKKCNKKDTKCNKRTACTAYLEKKDVNKEIKDQKLEGNENCENQSNNDLLKKWYRTPSTNELINELKDLLQGEAWETYSKRHHVILREANNSKPYLLLKNNNDIENNLAESTTKHCITQNSCAGSCYNACITKRQTSKCNNNCAEVISDKIHNFELNNSMFYDTKINKTDMDDKHVSVAVNEVNDEAGGITITAEQKNKTETNKAPNHGHNDETKQIFSKGGNVLSCEVDAANIYLKERGHVIHNKSNDSKSARLTNKKEHENIKCSSQERRKGNNGNTSEKLRNDESSRATSAVTSDIEDQAKIKARNKLFISYSDGYLIDKGIYKSQSLALSLNGTSIIQREERSFPDCGRANDVPDNRKNVFMRDGVNNVVAEENLKRHSKKFRDQDNGGASENIIGDRQFSLTANIQILSCKSKSVAESSKVISDEDGDKNSNFNDKRRILNNIIEKTVSKHSTGLKNQMDQDERKVTVEINGGKQLTQSILGDETLECAENNQEEVKEKNLLGDDTEHQSEEVHPFQITLQHVSNMLLTLCFKLNSVPPDIKFTPILNLNPPESLTKALLMLPILAEHNFSDSFNRPTTEVCTDDNETKVAGENICYEIKNILDVFGNMCKKSPSNNIKHLKSNENLAMDSGNEIVIRNFNYLSNTSSTDNSLGSSLKRTEVDITEFSKNFTADGDKEVNTIFSPKDKFIPIISNASSIDNCIILSKILRLFFAGKT